MIKLAVKTKKTWNFQVVCWQRTTEERQASENVPDLQGGGGS